MPYRHAAAPRHTFDLDAELAYWRGVHAIGRLGRHDFDQYRRLLQMGFEVYMAWPHASQEQLYRALQDSYHRHAPALAVPWEEARWLVRHAWQRAAQAASGAASLPQRANGASASACAR